MSITSECDIKTQREDEFFCETFLFLDCKFSLGSNKEPFFLVSYCKYLNLIWVGVQIFDEASQDEVRTSGATEG